MIDAYRIVRERSPTRSSRWSARWRPTTPRAGSSSTRPSSHADGDPDIKILNNLNNVGAIEVNAFQSQADVCMQKSIREGFGLTVTEAQWKGRPMIGGDVGGIPLQIEDGVSGFLVDSPEEAAERTIEILEDPELGEAARPRRQGARPRALPHAAPAARLARAVHASWNLATATLGSRCLTSARDRLQPRARPSSSASEAASGPCSAGGGGLVTALSGPGRPPRRALDRLGDDRRGRRGRARGGRRAGRGRRSTTSPTTC